MDDVVRRRLSISGRVQGVFYRAAAEREGHRLGLGGHARNLPDGRVEVVVEGPKDAVDAFIRWAKIGPPRAQVTDVTAFAEEPVGVTGFHTS